MPSMMMSTMILTSKHKLAMNVATMMARGQEQSLLALLDEEVDADIDDERRRPDCMPRRIILIYKFWIKKS